MGGRQWRAFAIATVAAMALSACGGEEAGDAADGMAADTAAVQGQQQAQGPANLPEGVTPEQYQQGQELFTGSGGCVACHGPDATGTQLAPDLTDSEWINISGPNMDEIVQLIQTGVPQPLQHPGPMPPMGGANLTDQQVEALAAYVAGIGQG